jgi:hypothetical protein
LITLTVDRDTTGVNARSAFLVIRKTFIIGGKDVGLKWPMLLKTAKVQNLFLLLLRIASHTAPDSQIAYSESHVLIRTPQP